MAKAVVTGFGANFVYIADTDRKIYKVDNRFLPEASIGLQVDFYPNSIDDEWVHLVSPAVESIEHQVMRQITQLEADMVQLRLLLSQVMHPSEEEMAKMADEFEQR